MYEELVKQLRESVPGDWYDADLHYEAADAIEELSVQIRNKNVMLAEAINERPQWIPVAERLPERGYYVLVYEDGDILMASYADGNWVLRDTYEVIDDLKPTHWMRLPESPKEET